MLKYLTAAFTLPWNLLALVGGTALAVMSGRPDVVLPLVAAAEIGYLAMLGTHPKFCDYVDAKANGLRGRDSQAVL
ncbi:MAG: hypothetical protein N2C14_20210, partial [Planctomycetales bacterium]